MKTYQNCTEAYINLLNDVYNDPEYVCAPRNMKIRESLGVSFRILNARNRLPYVPERKFSVGYVIAELLWYLSGNNSTEWIANYSSFWRKISDDGETANSAYGARIFRPYSRIAELYGDPTVTPLADNSSPKSDDWTQWKWLVEELVSDNDSRRAVIHIRSPWDARYATKDVPCTLTLQFFLRDDRVHQVASMRSSDLILGIAYDIPAFTVFQELLAIELAERLHRPIGVGTYTHISGSLHIYDRNFDLVERILENNKAFLDGSWVRDTSINVPAMPHMPGGPPIKELMHVEAVCRGSDLVDLPNVKPEIERVLQDPYWRDWGYVLAAHRASKLGCEVTQKEFTDMISFDGYRQFDK
jgi:thymidylate synthase